MKQHFRYSMADLGLGRGYRLRARPLRPTSLPDSRGTEGSITTSPRHHITTLQHYHIAKSDRAFSLIEMMIAIVILGLGLVMTATMFPVAWTRARTLTEYTTQRVVAQSAAAIIGESLRPSGSSFTPYIDASGNQTGKYFIANGSLAGDLFYDPVLHTDPNPSLRLPCFAPAQCYSHRAVLLPSDTRVHALHMENLVAANSTARGENPHAIEDIRAFGARVELCDASSTPMVCRTGYPMANPFMSCNSPLDQGAQFCARSFYSPQVGIGARMYPPMEAPPTGATSPAFTTWLEKFGTRRYAWAALHRLPKAVGPVNLPNNDAPLPIAASQQIASQAASAAGTTRTFDFYIVTLKRPQSTSRYALQDSATAPNPSDRYAVSTPLPLPIANPPNEMSLPVAWRVQIELPVNLPRHSAPPNDPAAPKGVPTEVQFPPTDAAFGNADERGLFSRILPTGAQIVDEVNGQVFRVTRRRDNAEGYAFLTLDRELLWEDFDDGEFQGNPPALGDDEKVRTVWVYPPPIVERTATTVVFDDTSPVIGIDIRSISMSPPG